MSFKIITDTACDIPQAFYDKLDVTAVPLTVQVNGKEQSAYEEAFLKAFYEELRKGADTSTSAVNPDGWANAIRSYLEQGQDVLVLAFSSGLSTTYQSAEIAASDLREQFPQQKIEVVDSLCASSGQGLLLYYACQKRDAGLSLEQTAVWCRENTLKLCHWFTVEDLMFLKRGGRISAATALVGTMLQIKPVLHVDNEGHLINVSKVRGRKASIDALIAKFVQTGLPGENETVFICHGDCIDDANYMASTLKEKHGVKNVEIFYTGAVIGSHSGPGTLALFFLGQQR